MDAPGPAPSAGGAGWRTFDEMLESVIKTSKTRVLSLINIVGHGMIGPSFEDNTADMDPAKTAAKIAERRQYIVGIKTAHFGGYGWTAVDNAIAYNEGQGEADIGAPADFVALFGVDNGLLSVMAAPGKVMPRPISAAP